MDDLKGMTRDELNDVAGERGIADAASYPNKAELIAAIEADMASDGEELAVGGDSDGADADDDAEPKNGAEPEPEPSGQRYTVLKAVTDEDGKTWMPGEEYAPGPGMPSRRPKQLVEQKFLRPLE